MVGLEGSGSHVVCSFVAKRERTGEKDDAENVSDSSVAGLNVPSIIASRREFQDLYRDVEEWRLTGETRRKDEEDLNAKRERLQPSFSFSPHPRFACLSF